MIPRDYFQPGRPALDANPGCEDLRTWLLRCDHLERVMQCRTTHHQRFKRHARQLTPSAIRTSRDELAVRVVEARLRRARQPSGFGEFARVWTRAELGVLITEATNRGRQLRDGERRPPGPRFDPCRIPDDRLAALIQQHADLAVVEQLRAERARRARVQA